MGTSRFSGVESICNRYNIHSINIFVWCTGITWPPGADCNQKRHGRMTIKCKYCYFRCPCIKSKLARKVRLTGNDLKECGDTYICRDFSSRSTIIIYRYIYHYLGLLKPCIYANTYIITRRVFTRLRDYNQYGRFPMQFIW